MNATIVIQMAGGLVQDVFIRGEGVPTKAIVIDEDVDGAEDHEITTVQASDDSPYEACIHTEDIRPLPPNSDVDKIVTEYLK